MSDKQVPKPASDIIKHIWSPSDADTQLIKSAYTFARDAHEGQQRMSGRPYFHHVVETARILASLHMDTTTIAAGLLHDTIDDTDVTAENLEDEFGEEILFLVQGISKLGQVRYQGMNRHIKSLRKLFVATSQDVRVLIIKLADRLHNMRTLEHIDDDKQLRIAEETLEVYVPIAHRLGIGKLKTELEDLAFPFVYPDEYEKTKELSADEYDEAVEVIQRMRKKLVRLMNEEDDIDDFTVDYRLKGLYSLYKKLDRKDMNIDEIYDIVALRIITSNVEDCYKVLGIVNSQWQPLSGRLKDYIASPKPNGYRSLHTTVFSGDGNIAEVQIRSEAMHQEAEYGVASHANYKADTTASGGYLEWFDDLLQEMQPTEENYSDTDEQNVPDWIENINKNQQASNDPTDFIKNLQTDYFEDRIFVFTPNGDVIDLPEGACPLDFAYQIHTEVGHKAAGVKVNNKMASLDTELNNGDIVEIITDEEQSPSRKWLEYVKTADARRKISQYIEN